jgi:NAD(P) transhydrogenase
MSSYDYELIVIGGGPAGEKGAAQAAYFGHKTALVEKEPQLGGACINTGTLASKTLRESSIFLSGAKARQLYGIDATVRKDIPLSDFMYRREQVQRAEWKRADRNLERHGIERIYGHASFVDAHTLAVKRKDGTERRITADKILIASGTTPARPKSVPFNDYSVFDSDSVLQMPKLPKSMVVIGGGVIGSEYAGLFQCLGIDCHLVHRAPKILGGSDTELAQALMTRMESMGVRMQMEYELDTVTVEGDKVRTKLKGIPKKDKEGKETDPGKPPLELLTDSLLFATGRSGNTTGLGLENLGFTFPDKDGDKGKDIGRYGHIQTMNPHTYQTKIPNIYAAGDVIGPPALASTSMEQARVAICHAFGIEYKTEVASLLPAGIYTIPELSWVGKTEDECRKEKINYVVGRSRYGDHGRGQIIGDLDGFVKLIFESPSGKLLGAHVIGEIASELVHIGMSCLYFKGGVEFFINSVFNYPTLGDAFKYAAYDALGQLNKVRATAPSNVDVAQPLAAAK